MGYNVALYDFGGNFRFCKQEIILHTLFKVTMKSLNQQHLFSDDVFSKGFYLHVVHRRNLFRNYRNFRFMPTSITFQLIY